MKWGLASMKRLILCVIAVTLMVVPVVGKEKRITFSADRMSGSSGKKNSITILEGNASVQIESLRISGDRIELSGKDFRYVLAEGKISGEDEEKGFSFLADRLTYDRETEIATFQGNAVLRDSKNDVETTAGLISYNQKTEVAFLQINVKLKRKNIESVSGFALYRRDVSLLDLSGSPRVLRSGDEFVADRITVDLETEYISLDGSVSGTLKETDAEPKSSINTSFAGEPPSPPATESVKSPSEDLNEVEPNE